MACCGRLMVGAVVMSVLGSCSSISSTYTLDDGSGRTSDGSILYMWGRNQLSQLGVVSCVQDTRFFTFSCLPDTIDRSTPAASPLLGYTKILNVTLGNTVSFVLLTDGSVYSWGEGQFLGVETSEVYTGAPNLVDGLAGATRVAVGYTNTLASFSPRQGNIIEYDDFQNFHASLGMPSPPSHLLWTAQDALRGRKRKHNQWVSPPSLDIAAKLRYGEPCPTPGVECVLAFAFSCSDSVEGVTSGVSPPLLARML
eukprot:762635-Hanusia_phi.AAC.3